MKFIKFLFSPVFMGILFIVFAVSMGVATFIENDYGSSAAYDLVYGTHWFELILVLLAVNLAGQMIVFRLYRRYKITIFLFHLSFILMVTGAAVTRYSGWEGLMHIREGEDQNICRSGEQYISYILKDADGTLLDEHHVKYSVAFFSSGRYNARLDDGKENFDMVLSRIVTDARRQIADSPDMGEPLVSLVLTTGGHERQDLILRKGDMLVFKGTSVGFDAADSADIRIIIDSGQFYAVSAYELSETNMMTRETVVHQAGERFLLRQMHLLSVNDIRIVPERFSLSGTVKITGGGSDQERTGRNAFVFDVFSEGKTSELILWKSYEEESSSSTLHTDHKIIEVSYGRKVTLLPFFIRLNEFVLERYPGSDSPSGYISDVVLIDSTHNVVKPFRIFMNNVLKYRGYRFYQSSYDQDEMGTILSVSHDRPGMLVSYTGYAFLFLFIILSLLNKRSFFRTVNAGHWDSSLRKAIPLIFLIIFFPLAGTANAQKLIPDKASSEELGKVLVQDQRGRTKPLYTLSNDILRKVSRENRYNGLTSMQVFLGIYFDFNRWKDEPLIKISNRDLKQKLGIRGDYTAFSDLVDLEGRGTYVLSESVTRAYSKAPADRNREDKEIMKVDERVNIIYMIYKGDFMKLFPLKDGSHGWGNASETVRTAVSREDSAYLETIIPMLSVALQSGKLTDVIELSGSISAYQTRFSEYDLPSDSKIKAELIYYKLMIFEKLFPYYATLGLIMLIVLIIMVIRGRKQKHFIVSLSGWLLFGGFVMHTTGLGLRWYISGHSPMSNGYESMLFISWVTLLAGFIFSRKSSFTLPATGVLASMTLMVAHLSFMDPEITNLVPVLKSYWLTLHVSVITGSYGFLGLGAILGIIVMVLMTFTGHGNRSRISDTVDELTVINYRSLTLGLYLLTIGTFLGAVWANESWGRYWGWDPKETWSLITIIVYSYIIHSRLIPGMKDIYIFNLLSLFGFSSVLMTYFGVNYYLSGLHSYAGGDPVPVPGFVYLTVFTLVALSSLAYYKYRKWEKIPDK